MSLNGRVTGAVLAFTLFVTSLGFNTFILSEGDPGFLFGLICLLFGFGYLQWYANPLFFLSLLLVVIGSRLAMVTSALSLILALSVFSIQRVPYSEAGDKADVIGYGPGFFLWLASILVLMLTSLWFSFVYGSQARDGLTEENSSSSAVSD
jgi:hypothetical protein